MRKNNIHNENKMSINVCKCEASENIQTVIQISLTKFNINCAVCLCKLFEI